MPVTLAAGSGAVGRVWLFERTDAGWSERIEVRSHEASPEDRFGEALSFDADAHTLVVGASGASESAGRAHVFMRMDGGDFEESTVLFAPYRTQELGASVAISQDGSRLFVGSPGWDEGGLVDAGGCARLRARGE
jgi:hypothetical protein